MYRTDMIYEFAVDPGINNDALNGYQVGQDWLNNVSKEVWQCTDNTTGAAVWKSITAALNVGLLSGKLVLSGIITPAAPLAGTVNNYTTTGISNANVVRVVTNGADVLLTGVDSTSIANGQTLCIINIDTVKKITLKDNDAGSTAANRFLIGSNIVVLAEKSVVLWYDLASTRWRKFNI